ncbi:hypothetical protein KI440_00450 [Candidatus Saccharibacteria bacterium TM7i]|nr:hypothetical protein KI440_00450 [Candidatus Saccharibacteria bacterium TM7i]
MRQFVRAAIVAALFAFLAVPVVSAADSKTANTLKVSPVRTDIEVPAGGKKVVQATVTNLADAPVKVTPVANDFIAGDERGTPALILNQDQYAPTHSLKRFMSPLSSVTIPPKGSKTINVVITVPVTAQAGGYFGAVRFMPSDPDEGGQVNLSPSVASLILLKVPGAIVEDLTVTTFEVQKAGAAGFYFQDPSDLQVLARFENKGNIQTAPLGVVQVRRGNDVVYETNFNANTPHDMILPDSARRWDVPLKDMGKIGYYTAVATFTYGEKNTTVTIEKSFLVAPLWLVLVVLAVPVLLIGGGILTGILVVRKKRKGGGRRTPKRSRGKASLVPKKRFGR